MIRVDKKKISVSGVACFLVGRNEMARLPWFLEHHRNVGVARFFYVDNQSTDGSQEFMLRQPDVYVWQAKEDYGRANGYGSTWQMKLARRYALGQWCLLLDIDEALVIPVGESITDLVALMEAEGSNMLRVNMLECYSPLPIEQTSPADCVWFDQPYSYEEMRKGNIPVDQKNARFRHRMFGFMDSCIVKIPLFKMNRRIGAAMGIHYLVGDLVCSRYVGALSLADANNGSSHCMRDVAAAYREGIGVKKDLQQSQLWQNKAQQMEFALLRQQNAGFTYFIISRFIKRFIVKMDRLLNTDCMRA